MTVTEFLLARIADGKQRGFIPASGRTLLIERTLPSLPDRMQRVIAAEFADHPDYRQEWKP